MKGTLIKSLLALILTVHLFPPTEDTLQEEVYLYLNPGFASAVIRIAKAAWHIASLFSGSGFYDQRITMLRNTINLHSLNSSDFSMKRRTLSQRITLLRNSIDLHSKAVDMAMDLAKDLGPSNLHSKNSSDFSLRRQLKRRSSNVLSFWISLGLQIVLQYMVLQTLMSLNWTKVLVCKICAFPRKAFCGGEAKPPRKSRRHLRHRLGRHPCCRPHTST